MAKFRVFARKVSYEYLDVDKVKTAEEAMKIAAKTDSEEFLYGGEGEREIDYAVLQEPENENN